MKKLVVLCAAIMLVCFSVPAMAVDWNFYGSARVRTFYVSEDYKKSPLRAYEEDWDFDFSSKSSQLQWDLQGNSRLGANVKAENIKGQFELALKGDGSGDVDVGTRRIYGTWDFGSGYLKVGKDYTPISQFISGQAWDVDLGMLGIGTMYGARIAQLALGFGGFEIALMQAKTNDLDLGGTDLAAAASSLLQNRYDRAVAGGNQQEADDIQFLQDRLAAYGTTQGNPEQVIPKIEAKYGMSFDAWNFNIRGGYQYYSIKDVPSAKDAVENPEADEIKTNDISVTSWIVGGDAGFNFGPGYVKAALSYGQNVGNAGWNLPTNDTTSGGYGTWDGDDSVDKNMSFMGALVGGIKVSDMLTFEAGFGYREDNPKDADNGLDTKQKAWNAYVQSVIALAPGVYIVPEVGYFDFGNDYTDEKAGSRFYAGGKWQIDF